MSTDETKQSAPTPPLQFDTAEPGTSGGAVATSPTCTSCNAGITTSYYEVNGEVVCVACRAKLQARLKGGSGSARFAKAIGFGLLAAAAGSALYYAILKLTGYEIGLVAIVVGFLVGAAVRRGSEGRGGRAYQVLAVGLTYFAIVTTYIPFIVKSLQDNPPPGIAAADSTARSAPPDSTALSEAGPAVQQQGAAREAKTRSSSARPPFELGKFLLSIAALLALAALAPVLAGFQNIVGMLIIGFALFEAWRQNQRLVLAVTGPYRVGANGGGGAAAAEAARA